MDLRPPTPRLDTFSGGSVAVTDILAAYAPAVHSSPMTGLERWRLYGADDPNVIAGGQSHVVSLMTALDEDLYPAGLRAAVAYAADFAAGPSDDDDYWDFLAHAGAGRTVAVVWDGNQHNTAFLLSPEPPFRVYTSTVCEPGGEQGVWIPQEMVRDFWSASFDRLGDVLALLSRVAQVLVLGTPPPKSDQIVRATLASDPYWAVVARELGLELDNVSVTPAAVRVALWRVLQDLTRDQAGKAGATFIPVPASAMSSDDLLLDCYGNPDVTHANSAYGELMWREIFASREGLVRS